jgi:hypothetical protein
MSKISYPEEGRKLLRSARNQPLWCMKHDKSYIGTSWALKELNNLEGALSTIKNSAQIKRFPERKETTIRYLIAIILGELCLIGLWQVLSWILKF